jgi:glycosyltransferase involved in cell wall biosynthesis
LNPSLTIVLPVHNGEARLRRHVVDILELASELTSRFCVLIVDDGSTDDTVAVAEELAARFPQIRVERNRHRRGLGPLLDQVRRRVRSDVVIVHDGTSSIDPDQLRVVWRERLQGQGVSSSRLAAGINARALADVALTHQSLAAVHRRMLGFQLISPEMADAGTSPVMAPENAPRTDAAHGRRKPGMGQIPTPPRPRFLSVLAEFALGE